MNTAGGLLDPMPDAELLGNSLDLSRTELRALMNRYTSTEPPRATTSILGPPTALIVQGRGGEGQLLEESLESEGWCVKTCPGPGGTRCPIMRGQPCPLRESADAAIVYVDPSRLCGGTGMLPRLRCAVDRASPGVIVLEGRLDPPKYQRTTAMLGALRGGKIILATLKRLLTKGAKDELQ